MTAIDPNTALVAGSDSDAFTQVNALWFKAPRNDAAGFTFNDLAVTSLVGRVTETGELILSAQAAADGSQFPVGITCNAVVVDGSNSLGDSNSAGDSEATRVTYYTDGEWNFDRVTMGAGWTLDLMRRALEAGGSSLHFKQVATATPTEPAS